MSIYTGPRGVTDGLILDLDASNTKSYPGLTSPEMVTNSLLLYAGDGQQFNVFRDSTTNLAPSLGCSVISGRTYIAKWTITAYRGSLGGDLRTNGSANTTPAVNLNAVGTYTLIFKANTSGNLGISGVAAGVDFDLDYFSIKEIYDNDSGSSWKDSRSLGNNVTLLNSPTYSIANSGGIVFNGTNQYANPSISHSYLSSSAIEVIFKSTNHGTGYKTIAGYRQNGGYSFPTLGSIYLNGNTLSATLIGVTDVYRTVTSSVTIAQNTNYHVVFNKDTVSGTMQLYVNGVLTGTQTFTAANYAQWPSLGSYIGANILDIAKSSNTDVGQGWGSDYFNGTIFGLKVYNKVLTAAEIQQNFIATRSRYGL